MYQVNRYYKSAKITEAKFRQLLRLFALDLTASDAARLTGLSRVSATQLYQRLRQHLVGLRQVPAELQGTVEVDESYFGPRRVRGKRGRGAGSKTIVFGLFKRGGQVYVEIVPDCSKATLQAIIRGKIAPAAAIHSDGWRGYDGLVDVGYDKHVRVQHGQNEFARGTQHINGIESFWSFAKRRLAQFNGVRSADFQSFLHESEMRFNLRHQNLYKFLLASLKITPL
jgi:transposase-like protein